MKTQIEQKTQIARIGENLTEIGHSYFDEWHTKGNRKDAVTSIAAYRQVLNIARMKVDQDILTNKQN